LESELYDSVITAEIHGELILIGTYGELLLIYDLKEVLQHGEISPIHTVSIASPILSIATHDSKILVLSSKGLHKLEPTQAINPSLSSSPNYLTNAGGADADTIHL
jgi:hypothetical protein